MKKGKAAWLLRTIFGTALRGEESSFLYTTIPVRLHRDVPLRQTRLLLLKAAFRSPRSGNSRNRLDVPSSPRSVRPITTLTEIATRLCSRKRTQWKLMSVRLRLPIHLSATAKSYFRLDLGRFDFAAGRFFSTFAGRIARVAAYPARSKARHMYQLATVRYGRHRSPNARSSFGLGMCFLPYVTDHPFFTPRS